MSKITDDIDNYLRTLAKNVGKPKYYGLYVDGNLITVGNLRIYRKVGLVKSALLNRLGYWRGSYPTQEQKDRSAEIVKYVDELLDKKIIEIKEV